MLPVRLLQKRVNENVFILSGYFTGKKTPNVWDFKITEGKRKMQFPDVLVKSSLFHLRVVAEVKLNFYRFGNFTNQQVGLITRHLPETTKIVKTLNGRMCFQWRYSAWPLASTCVTPTCRNPVSCRGVGV